MGPDCLDALSQEPVNGHSFGFNAAEWARGVTWEDNIFQFLYHFFLAFGILNLIGFPCVQLHTHFHQPSQFVLLFGFVLLPLILYLMGIFILVFIILIIFFLGHRNLGGRQLDLVFFIIIHPEGRHRSHKVTEWDEVFVVTIKTGDKQSEEHKKAKNK